MIPELYDPESVAALAGCCTETIRRMIRNGQLPAQKFGSRWKVRRCHVDALLAGELSTAHISGGAA